MTEAEQKEFLVNAIVSLLQKLLVYQSLVEWLKLEVGVPLADIEQVLDSARRQLATQNDLPDTLRTAVESALQSGVVDYDQALASFLSQWTPKGRTN